MTNLFQVILSLLNSEDLLTQYQGVYGLDLFVILGIVSRVALSAFRPVGPIRVQFNQMLPDLLSVLPTVIARQVQSLESSFSLNDLYLVSDSLRRTLSVGCDGWMACRRSMWSFFVESFPLATKY